MTITSDLEIIPSHHRRRQIAADAVPPIRGLLFRQETWEEEHAAGDPASPPPIDQLLRNSAAPAEVVHGFKIRF